MYTLLRKTLREWNESNNERVKLQHAYVASAVIVIVAAGLVGLINYDLGQQLTAIALLALGVFFVNVISWTLLNGIVLNSIAAMSRTEPETQPKAAAKKKQPAKKSKN